MWKNKKDSLYLLGKKREWIYKICRLLPVFPAIYIAVVGRVQLSEFWSRYFLFPADTNRKMCQEIVEYQAYKGMFDQMRTYLYGFEVAILLALFGIVVHLFYLKKKTNAYYTLVRLPKKKEYYKKIFLAPVVEAFLIYIIRMVFVVIYIELFRHYEGCEELVAALYENIWRILL